MGKLDGKVAIITAATSGMALSSFGSLPVLLIAGRLKNKHKECFNAEGFPLDRA